MSAPYHGIRPDSPSPSGYDLTTAAGYAAWRRDGGLWADETPEVMRRWRENHAQALAAEVDLDEVAA